MSILLFREIPSDGGPSPSGTPHGKIEMFTVEAKQRPNGRRVGSNAPKYESAAKQPCRLLICFNGPLRDGDRFHDPRQLARGGPIWPTVAVMVDTAI